MFLNITRYFKTYFSFKEYEPMEYGIYTQKTVEHTACNYRN